MRHDDELAAALSCPVCRGRVDAISYIHGPAAFLCVNRCCEFHLPDRELAKVRAMIKEAMGMVA